MAELQLAALLADLVHGEVHDPAELVPLLVHVALTGGTEGLDHYAHGLGGGFSGGYHHQSARLQVQGLGKLLPHGCHELADATGQLAALVHLEPVALAAGLHLTIGEQLLDLLAGEGAIGDVHHLHGLAAQGLKVAVFKEPRNIFCR